MNIRESKIENMLREGVKRLGGRALKFSSQSEAGYPDRIVLLPNGEVYFVELKAPGRKPTKLQELRIKELRELNQKTMVLDGLLQVEWALEIFRDNIRDAGVRKMYEEAEKPKVGIVEPAKHINVGSLNLEKRACGYCKNFKLDAGALVLGLCQKKLMAVTKNMFATYNPEEGTCFE